jgi:hypothetical protein
MVTGMTLQQAQESLIFACDRGSLGHDKARLSREADRGVLVRVKQGVYLPRDHWNDLDAVDRHRLHLAIINRLYAPGIVFSHQSAAALIGLPILGRWPDKAHVIRDCAAGGRSTTGVTRHALGLAGVPLVSIHGMSATAPARTVIDVAATAPFESAVVIADAALRVNRHTGQALTTPSEVRTLLDSMAPFRGMNRVVAVLDASTTLSDSAGETLCRLVISELGFPTPTLQVGYSDAEGFIGYADFSWRHRKVILEFDGMAKYADPRFTHGLTAEEIVIREKKREDRLWALGYVVLRVYWEDLRDPTRMRRLLLEAGVPVVNAGVLVRRDWL